MCLCTFARAHAPVDTLARLTPDQRVVALWKQSRHWLRTCQPTEPIAPVVIRFDSVRALAQHLNDEKLYWYATLLPIHHRVEMTRNTDTRFRIYRDAESVMERCPVAVVRASFHMLYGTDLFLSGRNRQDALRLLLQASHTFEQIGYTHLPEGNVYLSIYGNMYYQVGDYQKAIEYLKTALRYHENGLIDTYPEWNTLGMAYQRLGQYALAEQAFHRTIAIARQRRNLDYIGLGSGNLGNTLRLAGRYREALPYLQTRITILQKTLPVNAALSALNIARIHLLLDSTDRAKQDIELAQQLFHGEQKQHPIPYYETLTAYYRKTGNFALATRYLDSTLTCKDSLMRQMSNKALSVAEGNLRAEQYLSTLKQSETNRHWSVLVRNVVIAALLLLGLAGWYVIRQRQRQQRWEADVKLASAQAQLHQYVASLSERNALIERMSDELTTARQRTPEIDPAHNDRVMTLLNSSILTGKDWLQFRHLFEQVYPTFFGDLHRTHPNLTPAELRLLALLKLQVPTKQMAYMLGVSVDSVHKARYRLRKKVDEATDNTVRSLLEPV
ncbi:tetratricopeptide repeat protein [Spirosoma rhododendri]|uniref:Tetratricopeptide repeat protein n=1 Tax=Spirosoma rhododendri TaxID=2728024 RepID=A0A7L5DJB5_9BACT|nr:tetratricopeptide repeat protein [Spirosoma rhododendri]QJD78195.1 tetratricopeptide repeat protein [Spirosoma rhododendri]